ncbi:cryptochrome/photolyase family protein [Lacipirellula limnantheis]|uniref:Deoxyribodipyrimidine photo-lyase n=1 Tax=Lacipirellula limnantheis TaxID=2528024 RepID=A0A517TU10_9BACT|nr:deoxyribodipyrimidine photo-lyase [Lacipirellula limnantheis]QDT71854.1 Deoxyribodipyrimidine photo-lyase [Lacipirellula limnantheis]
MSTPTTIVWLRQDLRLADQPALRRAASRGRVIPVYIYAPEEEGDWPPGGASRWWLHHSLESLDEQLRQLGSRLIRRRGTTQDILNELLEETGATAVYWNRRYEPAAIERDKTVKAALLAMGVQAESFNGSLLYEPWTIRTKQDAPYQVFTPFWKACLATETVHESLPAPRELVSPPKWPKSLPLDELELLPSNSWDAQFYETWQAGAPAAERRLRQFVNETVRRYHEDRDRADFDGSSRLSPHLHFGELSPRQIWAAVEKSSGKVPAGKSKLGQGAEVFLKEVGWREFAYHLLYHFPSTTKEPLREQFRRFPWRRSATELWSWQRGQTGFPIVDAAMRQLWATGYMPNRTRMIVASFLTKDLRLSWQQGARWFWDTLVDADLANNTLGWQWTAGCGADAAPYFRVFNPTMQAEKADPHGDYIRRWVPELATLPTKWLREPWTAPAEELAAAGVKLGETYPQPMVDHHEARDAALAAYERVKNS